MVLLLSALAGRTAYGLEPEVLYSFTLGPANPEAALVQGRDGNFYGTTSSGGTKNYATVFRVGTNGALTTLVSFAGSNGAYPRAGLVQGSDGKLYGTTFSGALFSLSPPD